MTGDDHPERKGSSGGRNKRRKILVLQKRADIKDIVLSIDIKKKSIDIKPDYIKGLTFHYIGEMIEVNNLASIEGQGEEPD